MSAAAMNEIEIRLRILVPKAAGVYARNKQMLLQKLLGYIVARRAVLFVAVVCTSDVVLSVMLSIVLVAPLSSIDELPLIKSESKNVFVVQSHLFEKFKEKFSASIGDCSAVMFDTNPSWKRVDMKVGSGVSVVGEASSGGAENVCDGDGG
ncbi:uncharacterized protein MONOS_521 [Monocercomonoides exilis]|uniref:uncharacterized protein n=1 Tax=Monocercomonoides exilis TaxID=2049356 RepID=UPI003559FD04|nr:hypothetical protein MONOS_521 [Monocercomonoides exilis]|eukprot:MONOS_521.1-p1 / transcript=MONOS_521.1 / gene=MONOS_521 / organism=Monocercomonoides_exilis_PA203 / gene_product=unspecified product / transcript_product=unspecified product / location=Mono_scaffold00008:153369-154566(+) / protein_length=151 / sequence_SO=supercontig / SO=protein_coding / is_pseudo=false